jgi:HEAT repeat protein
VVAVAVVALAIAWLATAIWLRPFYLDLFRRSLRQGIGMARTEFPALDLASLESLIAALSSANDQEVVAALDLLHEKEKIHLVQAYILYHPSPAVVAHALELFSRTGRTDHLPIAERLIGHLDPIVRAAVLGAKITKGISTEDLAEFLADPSARVRGTALAGLLAAESLHDPRAKEGLIDLLEGETTEGRIALAEAVAKRPDPALDDVLVLLARKDDPALQRACVRAMRGTRSERFLPVLVDLLAPREVRREARETILALGEDVLSRLTDMLSDTTRPHAIRLHLPRTIAYFGSQEACDELLRQLLVEPDGAVRFKILKSLGFMHTHGRNIRFDRGLLDRALDETLRACFRLLDWRLRLTQGSVKNPERQTLGREVLVTLLLHKERHAIDRLFRLLHLRDEREDFRRIHRGLVGTIRKARANSIELLENLLEPPLRTAVVGLVSDGPDAERLQRAGAYHQSVATSEEEVLDELSARGGRLVGELVVYHRTELGG